MAGIYLHIPFCKQACNYCNFHFSTSVKQQNGFLQALLKEIGLRRDYLGNEAVRTIYFGGGTPSLLPQDHLQQIMDSLRLHYHIAEDAEITFEANPDDINTVNLDTWKAQGINRLSIGVQSFYDADLAWMNRAHLASQALEGIQSAQAAGFWNLSIDLIYGTPTLPDEHWQQNLETAVALAIPHLSCYALTVEPGTALDTLTRRKKLAPVDSATQARQFLILTDLLDARGYEPYEISNFALPGKRSRHNSAYWSGDTYLGLGPSAHSFNGHSRQWNIANNALYIRGLEAGAVSFEVETLTQTQRFNEYIMTSLRTIEGTDLDLLGQQFGNRYRDEVLAQLPALQAKGWAQQSGNHMTLTREGRLFADGIASDLFILGE